MRWTAALIACALVVGGAVWQHRRAADQAERVRVMDEALAHARASMPPPEQPEEAARLQARIDAIEQLRQPSAGDVAQWAARVPMLAADAHVDVLSLSTAADTIALETHAADSADVSTLMRALQAAGFTDVQMAFNELPERYAHYGARCANNSCNRVSMRAPRSKPTPLGR